MSFNETDTLTDMAEQRLVRNGSTLNDVVIADTGRYSTNTNNLRMVGESEAYAEATEGVINTLHPRQATARIMRRHAYDSNH